MGDTQCSIFFIRVNEIKTHHIRVHKLMNTSESFFCFIGQLIRKIIRSHTFLILFTLFENSKNSLCAWCNFLDEYGIMDAASDIQMLVLSISLAFSNTDCT